jgi:hypothetical protein
MPARSASVRRTKSSEHALACGREDLSRRRAPGGRSEGRASAVERRGLHVRRWCGSVDEPSRRRGGVGVGVGVGKDAVERRRGEGQEAGETLSQLSKAKLLLISACY